ncbi:hypothetical protein JNJ66_01745 [Candidatus Saccharibacteria bacterium]|nr:hypothetical protein [Candidatus Saccharibacteria bacterium]
MLSTTSRPGDAIQTVFQSKPVRMLLRFLGEILGVIAVAFVALLWGLVRLAVSLLEQFVAAANGGYAKLGVSPEYDAVNWVVDMFIKGITWGSLVAILVAIVLSVRWLTTTSHPLSERVTIMLRYQWVSLGVVIISLLSEYTWAP